MAIHKLTDVKIRSKLKEARDLAYSSPKNALLGDGQGLYLSIAKSGSASWLFRYMDAGKAKAVGLGAYPATSLQKARELAQGLRDARAGGVDPAAAKQEQRRLQRLEQARAKTFKTCAEEFIALSRPSWRNAKHAQQWENTLETYAYEVIGQLPIGDVDAASVVRLLTPIWTTKTETATRLRGRIEAIIDWAKVHGLREGDNPARLKGHLEHMLPKLRDSRYARIFEEEYNLYLNEMLDLDETPYVKYLKGITAEKTHSGYFSIDKKTKRDVDPDIEKRGENAGLSNDVEAYDLILKNKERLLSLDEPVRFIFSHSALREGWDNPNVFVICALKHSDNTISRRQEVGRGLRLSVNQQGDRMDHPAIVHDVNVLTVVASESYKDFVAALQKDISDSLSARPKVADEAFFTGKVLKTATGDVEVTPQLAKQIYKYLLKNDYTDDGDRITGTYHDAKKAETLAELPPELKPYAAQVYQLIDSVFSASQLPEIGDDRRPKKNPLNANFDKQEFKALWSRINRKAAYSVSFEEAELVQKAVAVLNDKDAGLRVTPLQYTIQRGEQAEAVTYDGIKSGEAFKLKATETEVNRLSVHSAVKYDLIGKLAEGTQLTRRTIAEILKGMNVAVFAQFKTNPESFIAEAVRLINEQKATVIIEHLAYDPVEDKFDLDIFTAGLTKQDFSKAGDKLQRHIYDYVLTDSNI